MTRWLERTGAIASKATQLLAQENGITVISTSYLKSNKAETPIWKDRDICCIISLIMDANCEMEVKIGAIEKLITMESKSVEFSKSGPTSRLINRYDLWRSSTVVKDLVVRFELNPMSYQWSQSGSGRNTIRTQKLQHLWTKIEQGNVEFNEQTALDVFTNVENEMSQFQQVGTLQRIINYCATTSQKQELQETKNKLLSNVLELCFKTLALPHLISLRSLIDKKLVHREHLVPQWYGTPVKQTRYLNNTFNRLVFSCEDELTSDLQYLSGAIDVALQRKFISIAFWTPHLFFHKVLKEASIAGGGSNEHKLLLCAMQSVGSPIDIPGGDGNTSLFLSQCKEMILRGKIVSKGEKHNLFRFINTVLECYMETHFIEIIKELVIPFLQAEDGGDFLDNLLEKVVKPQLCSLQDASSLPAGVWFSLLRQLLCRLNIIYSSNYIDITAPNKSLGVTLETVVEILMSKSETLFRSSPEEFEDLKTLIATCHWKMKVKWLVCLPTFPTTGDVIEELRTLQAAVLPEPQGDERWCFQVLEWCSTPGLIHTMEYTGEQGYLDRLVGDVESLKLERSLWFAALGRLLCSVNEPQLRTALLQVAPWLLKNTGFQEKVDELKLTSPTIYRELPHGGILNVSYFAYVCMSLAPSNPHNQDQLGMLLRLVRELVEQLQDVKLHLVQQMELASILCLPLQYSKLSDVQTISLTLVLDVVAGMEKEISKDFAIDSTTDVAFLVLLAHRLSRVFEHVHSSEIKHRLSFALKHIIQTLGAGLLPT